LDKVTVKNSPKRGNYKTFVEEQPKILLSNNNALEPKEPGETAQRGKKQAVIEIE